jgi:hypothetical protein
MHRYKKPPICKQRPRGLMAGCRTARTRSRTARAGRWAWTRRLRRTGGARRTGRTGRASRTRGTGRARRRGGQWSARGRGSKSRPHAAPTLHILRVLLERRRATVPEREVGAGVEQIARNQDLFALLGVAHTLDRLTRRHRGVGMSRKRDDGGHQYGAEPPSETAIRHGNSSAVESRSQSTVFRATKCPVG